MCNRLYFYIVRYKIKETLSLLTPGIQQDLRTYIIPTVLHKVSVIIYRATYVQTSLSLSQIDHGHDVTWFSELREVSVLFINLNPGAHLDASETLRLLQNSFNIVYPSLNKYNGNA